MAWMTHLRPELARLVCQRKRRNHWKKSAWWSHQRSQKWCKYNHRSACTWIEVPITSFKFYKHENLHRCVFCVKWWLLFISSISHKFMRWERFLPYTQIFCQKSRFVVHSIMRGELIAFADVFDSLYAFSYVLQNAYHRKLNFTCLRTPSNCSMLLREGKDLLNVCLLQAR